MVSTLSDLLPMVRTGRVVALTGAGISAESGIPTFRGEAGYWAVGSRNYHPEELATWATFEHDPDLVWPWYLYRLAVCRRSVPNPGHLALVTLQEALGERFVLVTQNVDGLHLLAGSDPARTWEIHGNIAYFRCAAECHLAPWPAPAALRAFAPGDRIEAEDRQHLRCPRCAGLARPHVLWFDESYDEARYRYHSSLHAAHDADLLLVIGTSGATSLPAHMAQLALAKGACIIDINPSRSDFSALAERSGGVHLVGPAGEHLPRLVADALNILA